MCQSFAKVTMVLLEKSGNFTPMKLILKLYLTFRSFENFGTHNQKSLYFYLFNFKIISFFLSPD
jgi:hypothetical protein